MTRFVFNQAFVPLDEPVERLSILDEFADRNVAIHASTGFNTPNLANIDGTEGDDVLVGTSEIDNIQGFGGNDTVLIGFGDSADGGTGTDSLSLSYADHFEGVSFDTTGFTLGAPVTLHGGTIRNFEILVTITGSAFSDYITAATQATVLTINGGAGFDVVYAGASSVVFNGGADSDTFNSGSAADTFNGGADNDMVSYFSMAVGGVLTLGLQPGQAGSGYGGDILIDVENVVTSAFFSFDDTVTGSNADNQISTFGGNDTIYGMGGNDYIQVGEGDDWIEGGLGDDLLLGGPGINHLIGGEGSDIYFYGDGAVPTADIIVELAGDPGSDVLRINPNGQAQIQDSAFTGIRNVEIAELRTLADPAGFEFVLGAQFSAAGFTRVDAGADIDASAVTTPTNFALATPNIRDMTVIGGSGADSFSFGAVLFPQTPVLNGQTYTLSGGGGYDSFRLSGGTLREYYSPMGRLTMTGIEEVTLVAGSAATAVAGAPDIAGTANAATVILTDGLIDPLGVIMVNGSVLRANVVTGFGLDGELGGSGSNADVVSQEGLTLDASGLTGGRRVNAVGGAAVDNLLGSSGNDGMNGGGDHDVLGGADGDDTIDGGSGGDRITGGLGRDDLAGSSGSDSFIFQTVADSAAGNRDRILDFEHDIDRLDLFAVDGNSTIAGLQRFTFIGGAAFSNVAGQLRYLGGILAGDTNGDGLADFEIELVSAPVLTATDLNLDPSNQIGGGGDNRLYSNTNSTFDGGAGYDTLVVTGFDTLRGLTGFEAIELIGGATLHLTDAQFKTGLAFGSSLSGNGSLIINMGVTDLELTASSLIVVGGSTIAPTINGSSGGENIKGAAGAVNTINGGGGDDQIRGANLSDIINGGDGNDRIYGGGGADFLTGGTGADVFRYQFANASGVGTAADTITDFVIGTDRLGFAQIDADLVTPGDQAFSFLGTGTFANTGVGQVRYQNAGADLLVQIDSDGNGIADMEIVLQGLAGQPLTPADFNL